MAYLGCSKRTEVGLDVWESAMIKSSLLRGPGGGTAGQAADEVVVEALRAGCKHLVLPSEEQSVPFSKWIKKELTKAAQGVDPLRVVVGCFVNEDCTIGSLFNSEDVPYLNSNAYPWAKAYHLVTGHPVLYHFDGESRFVPSASTLGRKLLLVELDSTQELTGTYPRPRNIILNPGSSRVGPSSLTDEVTNVLVSVPRFGRQWEHLCSNYNASVYKSKGDLEILAVPFRDSKEADAFLKNVALEPRGMFAIAKSALYEDSVLTLSCKSHSTVEADELFRLTGAKGVLPIGEDKYRIWTEMPMLKVAQVLNFQNRYIQKDLMKYKTLRNDKDKYVPLSTKKSPSRVLEYYRRPVPVDRPAAKTIAGRVWYSVTNLPNGVNAHKLLSYFQSLSWWPSTSPALLLDRAYTPKAWFQLDAACQVPSVVVVDSRPLVILPDLAPPADLENPPAKPASVTDFDELRQCGTVSAWSAARATQAFMASKYGKRAISGKRGAQTVRGQQKSGQSRDQVRARPARAARQPSDDAVQLGRRLNPAPVDTTTATRGSNGAGGRPVPASDQVKGGGSHRRSGGDKGGRSEPSASLQPKASDEKMPAGQTLVQHRGTKRKDLQDSAPEAGGILQEANPIIGCDPPADHNFRVYVHPRRKKQLKKTPHTLSTFTGQLQLAGKAALYAQRRFVTTWAQSARSIVTNTQ